ncbi:hypothetical protein [Glutamicibacter sp.]|uniref:hypothetical protein n=1 Tax=Glutamicibacter sp. TaxID=1931995 RepID=UPI0028BE9B48|nr:hypothetical protein [Glutamicibacter sp.]
MKREQFAVLVASNSNPQGAAWASKISQVAFWGSEQCRAKGWTRSASCTINGAPEELVVNLVCTAKSERLLTELVEYATEEVVPQMEHMLGVQFEVRNLQFAVAGHETLISNPAHLEDLALPAGWLDRPLETPDATNFDMA